MPASSAPQADSAVKLQICHVSNALPSWQLPGDNPNKHQFIPIADKLASWAKQAKATHFPNAACTTATSSAAQTCVRH
jgi:hypothetical protein